MPIGITYENLAIFAHSLKYSQSELACEQTARTSYIIIYVMQILLCKIYGNAHLALPFENLSIFAQKEYLCANENLSQQNEE